MQSKVKLYPSDFPTLSQNPSCSLCWLPIIKFIDDHHDNATTQLITHIPLLSCQCPHSLDPSSLWMASRIISTYPRWTSHLGPSIPLMLHPWWSDLCVSIVVTLYVGNMDINIQTSIEAMGDMSKWVLFAICKKPELSLSQTVYLTFKLLF